MQSSLANAQHPAAATLPFLLQQAESELFGGATITPLLTEARALAGSDNTQLARIALLHGLDLWRSGERRCALRHWIEAQTLAQRADHHALMAESWLEIGNWCREHGDPHRALRLHEHALTLAGLVETPLLQALCLLALATDALAINAPETAGLARQQALALRDEIPASSVVRWHEQLSALLLQENDLAAAQEELLQLLPLQTGRARLGTLLTLGQIALQQNAPEQALHWLQKGQTLADETAPGELAPLLHATLAVALELTGQTEAAVILRRQLRRERQARATQPAQQKRLSGLELKLQLLTSELEVAQLRSEAEAERQKLQLLETSPYRDEQTGLPNRLYLNERLPEMLAMTSEGMPLSLLLIDCDQLKTCSDLFGQATVDRVLEHIANFLAQGYSDTAVLVRYGHSTFALLLPGILPDIALRLAEQIRHRIAGSDWQSLQDELLVTVSIGHAAAQPDDTMEILLLRADLAMYLAKRQGGNSVADGDHPQ